MYKFEYHRAASIEEAAEILAARPEAKLLAGGMSLLPMMKLHLAETSDIVDLCDVPGLVGIGVEDDHLVIGAMTTHATVAASPIVRDTIPALAHLAGNIGDPHCRNRGTIGGSLAHSDPAACYPSSVLSLGATIRTTRREIAADEYFHGSFETALEDDEILLSVRFPIPERAAYVKFPQPASRFALVGVFLSKFENDIRIAVTGSADRVFRVPVLEQPLKEAFVADAIDGVEVSPDGLSEDIYAGTEYRAHLITTLAKRAVRTCNNISDPIEAAARELRRTI